MITALDKVEPAVRAIKSGAADYLVKPVQPEVLAHAVNRALTQHSLLKENEALRTTWRCSRPASASPPPSSGTQLFEATAAAFLSMCAADAVVVFTRDGSRSSSCRASQGFGELHARGGRAADPRRGARRGRPRSTRRARRLALEGLALRDRLPGARLRRRRAARRGAALLQGRHLGGRRLGRALPGAAPGAGAQEPGQVRRGGRPGLPRRSHPPLQQPLPAAGARQGIQGAATRRQALRPALPRPRLLQERQRHPRPPGGLASCWWRWPGCSRTACATTTSCAAGAATST